MQHPFIKAIIFIVLFCLSGLLASSQTLCPPNLDFEDGNFNNWTCKNGSVSSSGSGNTLNLVTGPAIAGRHTIITFADTSTDKYGGFPVLCPNNSGYSVKLGNENVNSEAEGVFYTYTIPPTATNFAILYNYAVVFQNPGHAPPEQPRFRARVINLTDGDTINCVSFDFTSSATLPGFKTSPLDPEVLYKDWTPVSLNLRGYNGKTISIEFITSDCTLGGHFGYAYLDVNSQCNGSVVGSTICVGDTAVTLVAPYGYQNYTWFTDLSFSQVLDTVQILKLNPAPNVGTVYPVIVNPYPGFGCKDTIYANIVTDNKPPSFAGLDTTVCRFTPVQLGTTPNPAYLYKWTPTNLMSNPVIANPLGTIKNYLGTKFIVKTTNRSSGCFSYDTAVVTAVTVDSSLILSGKNNYCTGEVYNTSMTISNLSTGIQWLYNNTLIAGATTNVYTPLAAGAYKAKFVQNGCIDTTRTVIFTDHVSPKIKFIVNKDTQCVTNNSFAFTNQSTIVAPETISYVWKFGDGTQSQIKDPVKSYTTGGSFKVWLHGTSQYNCADSVSAFVKVFPNVNPDFSWGGLACTNNATRIINSTNENGSTLVKYLWDLGNSSTSILKDPLPFNYVKPGTYPVSLQASALGCETAPQSVTKSIIVFEPQPGIRYKDATIPYSYSRQLIPRWGLGNKFSWSPATQLSNPATYAPYFKAINDQQYLIAITDEHRCIITDTLQIYILKKQGSYLPNAFTPNNDGLNDVIQPYLLGMKGLKRFAIYNRVGNLIFYTTRDGEAWDGKYKGNPAEAGTYVWFLEFFDENNNPVSKKGSLMLLR